MLAKIKKEKIMSDAFETLRYIQKRMIAGNVPAKEAESCDCIERIIEVAERALKKDWITHKRTEEMHFVKVGNRWIGNLMRI